MFAKVTIDVKPGTARNGQDHANHLTPGMLESR